MKQVNISDLQHLVQSKKLTVQITADGRPLPPGQHLMLQGENLLFYSLLSNLVKNAVGAAPNESPVRIEFLLGERISIAIHNQGEVPQSIRGHFFEKYITAGKKFGTGLGTYSAKLIARTMGGDIRLASSAAQGVTVTVFLPNNS